ncbi:hypothetical protein ACVWZA_001850 [Sphingomonas sp. UYAg733]
MPSTTPSTAIAPDDLTERILSFVESVGIRTSVEPLGDASFMPGMSIRNGALLVDPDRLAWPGDLLHEAGHIAVTDPAIRQTLCDVHSDPAEEMAAMCWSYAAAVAMDLEPGTVFHDGGYRGGGSHLAETYAGGSYIGLPMLQYWGMTIDPRHAAETGTAPFPHMRRWLR